MTLLYLLPTFPVIQCHCFIYSLPIPCYPMPLLYLLHNIFPDYPIRLLYLLT